MRTPCRCASRIRWKHGRPSRACRGEQRVSRVLPGGGHVTATRTALANWEAAEAEVRRNNVIVHESEIAARQRAEEERREAERKAGPDP
jgi:hypothetical protein